MTNFTEVELGKTKIQFIDGDRSSRYPKRDEFVEEGIMFLNAESINSGSINKAVANYISEEKFSEIKKGRIKRGDLLLTTRGNGVGNVAYVNTNELGLINAQMLIIRTNEQEISSKFLFYYFSSTTLYSYIQNFASGSAQPQIPIRDLKKIPVFLPSLKIQEKIAVILSAYDDLIENNKKRIQILENMAEELYREWFVRFRFPNWENTEFEKGVPKGWEIEKVSNLVDRKKFGRVYKEFELASEGSVPVIDQSQKNILGFHEGEAEHKASFESPIIIFGDHSCKMQMMFKNFSLAENVIPFKSKSNISLLYLFSLIKDQVETTEYKRHWGELTSKKVLLAPISLQEKYASLIIDKMKLIENLKTVNNYLVNCRDQLLPRLISGKLSVENLDIQFPPSMQEQ